ncbi:Glutaconyl-CoA decarboxylase subunit gamma [Aedoeadaptatus ivorii]|uniref:Glutaconyl-CoA decarboxylase subunit gamma n=1 Tax=Aedoeadaptatus ivorii TaxID=54006 RepID=A0A448V158_9FIRM|nr:acetyl-CoA carboxylase biotin carboxyl carrier protein subunit [Peptoniphilus ivorii]MDQ0507651.1 biotin carboxyl carrier protein [Peptoniphilus ivorii]VEJ35337.1 Glutaconyl-CoA decarboxylase subunit gamma [Peptoniphilus ivorii]
MKIYAPLPGKIETVFFEKNNMVSNHAILMTLESMKMYLPIFANATGVLVFTVRAGDTVVAGDVLAEIETEK